ncbi:hypothetical protein SELMODRAFT_404777 [Selaginella moellendorffii]|uniref:Uncharacterized protein n=1 Tax=Selaginella moellendorffii TaxID=88036 RepID=D8QWD1_SELML|nr:hypothetical protein SELMODRAFT_404777 [Selaginella moellendorffii]
MAAVIGGAARASQDRKGPSVSTARTLLCKAASKPRKEATQQDENHGIEVVDVSGLGDGQVLEQAGSKSQARDEVPIESGGEDEATSPHPLAWSLAGVQELREGLGPVTSQEGLRGIIPSTFAVEGTHRDGCLTEVQERHTRVRAGVTTRAAARAAAAKPGRGTGELKSAPPRTSKNRGKQDGALLSCRLNMEASLEGEFTIPHSEAQPSQEISREPDRSAVVLGLNKELPLRTLKFAHRCLSDLTNKPRASLPASPARSSSVRPRSSPQPPVTRRCTDLRQGGDSTDCLHLVLPKPASGGIVFWNSEQFTEQVCRESAQRIQQEVSQLTHQLEDGVDVENISLWDARRAALAILTENLRTRKDWAAGTLPAYGNASSSCPAGGNPSSHPETLADVAGLIPDPVHARVQEETHQVDPAHLQQVRKSDPDSPTTPHEEQKESLPSPFPRLDKAGMLVWDPRHFEERIQSSPLPVRKELQSTLMCTIRELDLNPLGEDLVLGPALRQAQELITKAVVTQQADLFDAWAQEQGGKLDTMPTPTVEEGLEEPETEPETERSLEEQSDGTLQFQDRDAFNKRKTKREKKKVKRATRRKLKTLRLAKEDPAWTNTVEAFLEEEHALPDKRTESRVHQNQEVDTPEQVAKAQSRVRKTRGCRKVVEALHSSDGNSDVNKEHTSHNVNWGTPVSMITISKAMRAMMN